MQIRNIPAGACCLIVLTAAGIAYAAPLSKVDKQFMITAAKTDMTEAHEGQMAENQAMRTDIKDFAKTLIQDHTKSYQRLTKLAAETGISIPKGIDGAKDRTVRGLGGLKGERFEGEFARDEMAAHRQAIVIFKREASHGQNAEVKAYATEMVPVLEKHLHLAEDIAKPARHS